ncbi:hypothetical protein M0804_001259 [Polistes exclamans]|nr:hypothetical protein M0804_001259 [Polistes exclamans]
MMQDEDLGGPARRNIFFQTISKISQAHQRYLDLWTPHVISRWVFALLLVIIFFLRVFLTQGWYIVTYALGIYHLNLFIAFLTPKIDPAMDLDDIEGPELPTRANEEFRPFIRRLPEFKFWYSVTKSTIIAMICTLFDFFNIPVFWPILVMYFITLFCITMKRQIKLRLIQTNISAYAYINYFQHMIKYRYLPFTHGKPKYQNHEDTSRLIPAN